MVKEKPRLSGTGFGWIDVDEDRISHDILIRLDGEVTKRKKKLSKEILLVKTVNAFILSKKAFRVFYQNEFIFLIPKVILLLGE